MIITRLAQFFDRFVKSNNSCYSRLLFLSGDCDVGADVGDTVM
jgi:hypothetical protein